MIRFLDKLLVAVVSCVVLSSCDVSELKSVLEESGEWTPTEVDETVEDVWLDTNGGELVELGEWLKSDANNTLEWISKGDAVALEKAVKEKYGVQLCAIRDQDLENYTVSIVAKVPSGVDRAGLQEMLEAAPSAYQVEVLMGNKWLMLDGLLSERGEYVPR